MLLELDGLRESKGGARKVWRELLIAEGTVASHERVCDAAPTNYRISFNVTYTTTDDSLYPRTRNDFHCCTFALLAKTFGDLKAFTIS